MISNVGTWGQGSQARKAKYAKKYIVLSPLPAQIMGLPALGGLGKIRKFAENMRVNSIPPISTVQGKIKLILLHTNIGDCIWEL